MSPAAGRAFGAYRLLRPIASDAVSTTYYATSNDAGYPSASVASTQFTIRIAGRALDDEAHTVEVVRRFLADVQKAGAVDHPSIVRPRDLGVIDGHPYVVTPFVRAVPLGDMLTHRGPLEESTALAIFAQLAGGLDAAHRADVVHGALSPHTIWVGPSTGDGVAYVGYLTGFGSSMLLREQLELEPRGRTLDDLLYVAPEQLRGQRASRATDQYSLACALFHVLAGRPPFERPNRPKLYGAHLMAIPPVLAEVSTGVAANTSAALQRGMRKEATERFASCGLMVNAALQARPPGSPAQPATARVSAADRHSTTRSVVTVALVATILAMMLWLVAMRNAGPGPGLAGGDAVRSVAAVTAPAVPAAPLANRGWSAATR